MNFVLQLFSVYANIQMHATGVETWIYHFYLTGCNDKLLCNMIITQYDPIFSPNLIKWGAIPSKIVSRCFEIIYSDVNPNIIYVVDSQQMTGTDKKTISNIYIYILY